MRGGANSEEASDQHKVRYWRLGKEDHCGISGQF